MALASSFFYGISALLTRRLGSTESGAVLANFQNVVYLGAAAGVAIATNLGTDFSAAVDHGGLKFLLRPWIMPELGDFLLIASTGIVGAYGSFLLAQAYRLAEAAVVAPFEYVAIMLAVIFGWWIWGEIPVPATFAGIALVIGAGLYVLRSRPLAA
jgi:S-adenosylmethionine uptake transporter